MDSCCEESVIMSHSGVDFENTNWVYSVTHCDPSLLRMRLDFGLKTSKSWYQDLISQTNKQNSPNKRILRLYQMRQD